MADWEDKTARTLRPDLVARPGGERRGFLVVVEGGNPGEMFALTRPTTVIGRHPSCEILLTGEGISRRHAQVVRTDADLVLEDLGSTNGTWVGDARIQRHQLAPGDRVFFGDRSVLRFDRLDGLDEAFLRRLHESSLRDGLTRLYGRRYLADRLDAELAFSQRHRVPLALVIADVDGLRAINAAHGTAAGDGLLHRLAATMQRMLRQEDVLVHLGAGRFAIVCRETTSPRAVTLAERLRQSVSLTPIEQSGGTLRITLSLGVASLPSEGLRTANDLVDGAERALARAKASGPGRVGTLDPPT